MRINSVLKSGLIGVVLTAVIACGAETPDRKSEVQNDETAAGQTAAGQASGGKDSAMTTDSSDAEENGVRVLMSTNLGEIELLLDEEKAPLSVANFLSYADSGHYNGTIFHRVIAGFMIQGGGFDATLQQKATQAPIENEAANGLKNVTYSLAMARTQVVNSATSQFFINVADNAFLDHRDTSARGFGYAVFGRVVAGQDIVDKIAATQTGAAGRFPKDVPVEAIVIESVARK